MAIAYGLHQLTLMYVTSHYANDSQSEQWEVEHHQGTFQHNYKALQELLQEYYRL